MLFLALFLKGGGTLTRRQDSNAEYMVTEVCSDNRMIFSQRMRCGGSSGLGAGVVGSSLLAIGL